MHRFSLVTVIFTIAITLSVFQEVSLSVMRPCSPCLDREECEENPPDLCPWGESRDPCGRRVCSKGPGERCGGLMNALGECGEGLMCRSSDEKCHGCSLVTLDCFN
ncbi:unnamed protein product [Brassicogethes aeneus]|uniref:Uncharacterized protein n=1 Tax=Brassicogethes aeneus TaxID=1431903 RepID=A0A9P0B068_BRAAE|nr:unnamed protein product [Brassicogethes aeneus]